MRKLTFALIGSAFLAVLAALPAYGTHSAANGLLADEAPLVAKGRIVFVADTAGDPQLFTISPDGSGLRKLTNRPGGAGEYGLALSPDGSVLMVISSDRDLIYKANAGGAGATLLRTGCARQCLGDNSPSVARSGTKIAFERAFGPVTNDTAAAVGIFTMNADMSKPKQLTQTKRPTSTEDHAPDWSPDGRRIVFQRLNTTATPVNRSAIYVMNADGSHVRRLSPSSMDASNPRWSRDGTKIAFNDYAEDVPGKSANIYTVRSDGSGLRRVTHYSGGELRAFVNDWSLDGRQIVYHAIGNTINDLYIINADGTGAHALTHLGPDANPRRSRWGTAR